MRRERSEAGVHSKECITHNKDQKGGKNQFLMEEVTVVNF